MCSKQPQKSKHMIQTVGSPESNVSSQPQRPCLYFPGNCGPRPIVDGKMVSCVFLLFVDSKQLIVELCYELMFLYDNW